MPGKDPLNYKYKAAYPRTPRISGSETYDGSATGGPPDPYMECLSWFLISQCLKDALKEGSMELVGFNNVVKMKTLLPAHNVWTALQQCNIYCNTLYCALIQSNVSSGSFTSIKTW